MASGPDTSMLRNCPKLEKLHTEGMHSEAAIPVQAGSLVSFIDKRPFDGNRWTPEYLDVIKLAQKLLRITSNSNQANKNRHEILSGGMRGIGMSDGPRYRKWKTLMQAGLNNTAVLNYQPLQLLESFLLRNLFKDDSAMEYKQRAH
ncbi:hypothetical protein EDD18DRAFT_1338979 [Armillaria luteobubalina]|uniref:Uncharacterized protein n=1 Tax=Armillaria luteobubalina TaxID=153913 RepID=A0AA39T9Z0_9AGAR|nr:hypothetical protein EDD18DRAFT_1338979 [Armillaria luteobubalina]